MRSVHLLLHEDSILQFESAGREAYSAALQPRRVLGLPLRMRDEYALSCSGSQRRNLSRCTDKVEGAMSHVGISVSVVLSVLCWDIARESSVCLIVRVEEWSSAPSLPR